MARSSSSTRLMKLLSSCSSKSLAVPILIPAAGSYRTRRAMHEASYEKNVEELGDEAVARATKLIPDEVIGVGSVETTWAPHPETGVFAPADDDGTVAEVSVVEKEDGSKSVLDESAWFRPVADVLEKPLPEDGGLKQDVN